MVLAVNTLEGQKLMEYQERALDLFVRRFPKMKYSQTATSGEAAAAVADAVFFKEDNSNVSFIVEVKSRNITHDKLINEYNNEWLLSLKKIDKLRLLSDLLCMPFWGFLYIQPEDILLYIKIYDPIEKGFTCDMRIETKTTTGPILHEVVTGPCAFINMKDAYIIKGDDNGRCEDIGNSSKDGI